MKAAIAHAVLSRANGHCEGCGGQFGLFEWTPELDHFFSRARAKDSVDTIWALHRACHRDKTAGRPSAAEWLRLFAAHCTKHSYTDSLKRAEDRLFLAQTKETFRKAGT